MRALSRVMVSSAVAAMLGSTIARQPPERTNRSAVRHDRRIVAASGGGFDDDGHGLDLLLNAVQAAERVDALDDDADLTVFVPDNRAFVRLARELGYDSRDERGGYAAIADALTPLGGGDPVPCSPTSCSTTPSAVR